MDNLTHTMTGYMLGRAGLDPWCPRASLIAMLAANAPDVDFVSLAGGDQIVLECHRGATHSIVWSPVVALIPLAIVFLFARKGMRWRRAWLVSFIGVASHCLLDWTNIYGLKLLTPVDDAWHSLDITSVVDVWVLVILISAVAWMTLSRLVSGEIGARRASGRGTALLALALLAGYSGTRWFLHGRAIAVLESRLYGGAAPLRVAALPHFANPLRWNGLVETDEAFRIFDLDLRETRFDPAAGEVLYKPAISPAIEAAARTEPFRAFLDFAMYPYWRETPGAEREGYVEVQALDLRFALPGEGRFAAIAIVREPDQVEQAWYQYAPPGSAPRVR